VRLAGWGDGCVHVRGLLRGCRADVNQALPHALETHTPLLTSVRAHLGLKAHVQHAVRLVQRQVADGGQRHARALDQVGQAAGGGHQDVAAALNLTQLSVSWVVGWLGR